MALKVILEKRSHKTVWKSGNVYSFYYHAYHNDPYPLIILLNIIEGIHPNTGHQWRFIQGINLHYIKISQRRQFAKDWMKAYNVANGNIKFTWKIVKSRYRYLEDAVRRYFIKPAYYIKGAVRIPHDDMEMAIAGSKAKDFSKRMQKLGARIQRMRAKPR